MLKWIIGGTLAGCVLALLVASAVSGGGMSSGSRACGPDAAPAQAAAVGFTCEVLNEGNPWTLATIDINNTQAAGFNWYVNYNFPRSAATNWTNQGINSPGDFSISAGKLVFAPTALTSIGGGSVHVGNITTCNQASSGVPLQGRTFSGGMYFEVIATWPNGSTKDGTATGWPIAWTIPTSFLTAGTAGPAFNFVETDLFEAAFQQNFHVWTTTVGGADGTDNRVMCTGCPSLPTSGTKYGSLLVPARLNGGTDAYSYYANDSLLQSLPPPTGLTTAQSFGLAGTEKRCLLLGAGNTNPATFSTVRVWQLPGSL